MSTATMTVPKAVIKKPIAKTLKKYRFKGSIKRFETIVLRDFEVEVTAISKNIARELILNKAKLALDILPSATGFIVLGNIEEVKD